jgi:exodeoxyribonuclease-3
VRVATWNVNGLRARLEFLRIWLRQRRPDVVGLQELKLTDEQFPHAEVEAEGYRAAVHGQKSWNGVAILTRDGLEAEVTQTGLPGQEEFGARLLTARLLSSEPSGTGPEGLSFTTIYVPNGKSVSHDDFPRKLVWLEDLAGHFREHHDPERPAVLCGDFNIVPAAIDSWNEEKLAGQIFHTSEERTRFAALLDWGFLDAFREHEPGERAFSWWDYRGGSFHRGLGLRIDLLLATSALMRRVGAVEIDREFRKKHDGHTASDHAPVWLDLV